MEYLMTYGWAILVVLLVGVALYHMGAYREPVGRPTVVGFDRIEPVNPSSIQVNNTGMSIIFLNTASGELTINDVTLEFERPDADCSAADYVLSTKKMQGINIKENSITVPPGEVFDVEINGCSGIQGESYRSRLTLDCTIKAGGFEVALEENGTIMGPIV